LATIVVAFFTGTLYWATTEQGRLTEQSIKLARDEFNATYRPEIIVHAIQYIDVPTGSGDILDVVGASLVCFNKGGGAAKSVEVRGEIIIADDLGIDIQRHLIETVENVPSGTKLRFAIVSRRSLTDMMVAGKPYFCVGTIAYLDSAEVRRETGFCFRLAYQPPRWEGSGSQEHVYAY